MRRTIAKARGHHCPSGKTRFRDHTSAAAALQRNETSVREVKPVRAYECPMCRGWHLTSRPA